MINTRNLTSIAIATLFFCFSTSCTKSENSPKPPQDTVSTSPKTWQVSTFAGSGWIGTRDGAVAAAQFSEPSKITFDTNGNMFVLDFSNRLIRKIANGVVSTYAGQNITIGDPPLNYINDFCIDSKNNIYSSSLHYITKLTSPTSCFVFAGALSDAGITDGKGADARFNLPYLMTVDKNGNLYVPDIGVGPIRFLLRKVTPDGVVSTVQLKDENGAPYGEDKQSLYSCPLTIDNAGNIYFTAGQNYNIKKADPTGKVTLFAGSKDEHDPNGIFSFISSIVSDAEGNIFVSDANKNAIFKITAKGTLSTIAGSGPLAGHVDGAGDQAKFDNPTGLAIDNTGAIYVADKGNGVIRKIEYK